MPTLRAVQFVLAVGLLRFAHCESVFDSHAVDQGNVFIIIKKKKYKNLNATSPGRLSDNVLVYYHLSVRKICLIFLVVIFKIDRESDIFYGHRIYRRPHLFYYVY